MPELYNPATALSLKSDTDNVLLFPTMLSDEWVDFPGEYITALYDVELNDGTILESVYPVDHIWDGHDSAEVKRIRFSKRESVKPQEEVWEQSDIDSAKEFAEEMSWFSSSEF